MRLTAAHQILWYPADGPHYDVLYYARETFYNPQK